MKAIIICLALSSCASVFREYDGKHIGVIKFERFGKIQYDYCVSVGTAGDRAFYVKEDIVPVTNYIKGDFVKMTYADYLKERK